MTCLPFGRGRALLLLLALVLGEASAAEEPFDLWHVEELIVNGYRAEDVAAGPVLSQPAMGFAPLDAAQPDAALRPSKSEGAVTFSAGSGQHLVFGRVEDALRSYRWALLIFRVDGADSAQVTELVTVNASTVAGGQTPQLLYDGRTRRVAASWRGMDRDGTAVVKLTSAPITADGTSWNVALVYRRAGRLYLSVNGQTVVSPPDIATFSAPPPQRHLISEIGAPDKESATWGYDMMVFGQSELSEAMVQVIEGWAMWRAGRAEDLSAGHPYRATPPTMSDADLGTRYHFDAEAWGALWARNPRQVREAFRGEPLPGVTDHVPVFLDDFRAARVARSDQIGNGRDAIWYAPGWNGSVGKAARMADPDRAPELYAHDPDAQTLTLSIGYRDQTWLASALYSVNDAGQGHSWEGEAIYRVRVRLPRLAGPPDVGHFPAIPWFYNLEHLFWRTGERIEIDAFEFEGIDPLWINGGSSHVHPGQYPGRFGHLSEDAPRGKIIGDRLDLNIWDGMFHDWEMRIGREVTILGLDGPEIARIETPPEYLERLYMIADYALKPGPEPDRERLYGME
ncbi:MAG: hypothetical protein AAFR50_02690, partial [Pseudomonadota bacterium]